MNKRWTSREIIRRATGDPARIGRDTDIPSTPESTSSDELVRTPPRLTHGVTQMTLWAAYPDPGASPGWYSGRTDRPGDVPSDNAPGRLSTGRKGEPM